MWHLRKLGGQRINNKIYLKSYWAILSVKTSQKLDSAVFLLKYSNTKQNLYF